MPSTMNISIKNIPDGSYTVVLDDDLGNRLYRGVQAFVSEDTSVALSDNVGTHVIGYVDDNDTPSINAAYIEGYTD